MVVTLKSYLDKLAENEIVKPPGARRKVPSVAQLADRVGIHQTTLNRIANNETRKVDLDVIDKVITELRGMGFPVGVNDVISYREPIEAGN